MSSFGQVRNALVNIERYVNSLEEGRLFSEHESLEVAISILKDHPIPDKSLTSIKNLQTRIIPFCKKSTTAKKISVLLKNLSASSSKESSSCDTCAVSQKKDRQQITDIAQGITDPTQLRKLTKALEKIPRNEKDTIVGKVMSLCDANTPCYLRIGLIEAICSLASRERTPQTMKLLAHFLEMAIDENDLQALVNAVRSLTPQKRIEMMKAVTTCCNEIDFNQPKILIFNTLSKIQSPPIDIFLTKMIPYCCQLPDPESRFIFLNTTTLLPSEHRKTPSFETLLKVFQNIENISEIGGLYKTLSKINSQQLWSVLKTTTPLFTKINDGTHRATLLKIAAILPSEKRETSLIHQVSLFALNTQDQEGILTIFEALQKIPPEERDSNIQDLLPFIQNSSTTERGLFLKEIISISKSERDFLKKELEPFCSKESLFYLMKLASFLDWQHIPLFDLQRFVEFFQTMEDPKDWKTMSTIIKEIPVEARGIFLENITPHLVQSENRIQKILICKTAQILPKNDWNSDSLQKISIFFNGVHSEQTSLIIDVIKQIPEQQRLRLIEAATHFCDQDLNKKLQKHIVLKVIDSFTSDSRDLTTMSSVIHFLNDLPEDIPIDKVLNSVKTIPVQNLDAVLNLFKETFSKNPNTYYQALKTFSLLPDEEKSYENALLMSSLFAHAPPSEYGEQLFHAFQNTSLSERVSLLNITKTLFNLKSSYEKKITTLTQFSQLSSPCRQFFFNLQTSDQKDLMVPILKSAFISLPKSLTLQNLNHFFDFFKGTTLKSERSEMYKDLQSLPSDKLSSLMERGSHFFSDISPKCRGLFLKALDCIEKKQPPNAKEIILPDSILNLFTIVSEESFLRFLVQRLEIMPFEEIVTLLTSVMHFLPKESLLQTERFLQVISLLPKDQLSEQNIREVSLLFKGIKEESSASIIAEVLLKTPQKNRFELIHNSLPFLNSLEKENERAEVIKIISILNIEGSSQESTQELISSFLTTPSEKVFSIYELCCLLPQEERTAVHIQQILMELSNLSSTNSTRLKMMLTVISPQIRLTSLHYFLDQYRSSNKFKLSDLEILFSSYPEIKTTSYNYLMEELERLIHDAQNVFPIATCICQCFTAFSVTQDDALVQKAIPLMILADPKKLNDVDNPYKIYDNLLKENQTPLINIPTDPFEGFSLDFSGTRRNVDRYEFTIKKYPEITFEQLFGSLRQKLSNPAVCTYIEDVYPKKNPHDPSQNLNAEAIISSLEQNILRGDVIPRSLKIPDLNQKVSSTTFYLHAILDRLHLTEATLSEENPFLSPQETALLNFAEAVQFCKTGQIDGIANYYRYAVDNQQSHGEQDEILFSMISSCVQNSLQETLSSKSLIERLVPHQSISQLSHQSLYLKNKLHRHLGLKHTLTFDLYTGVLLKPLLSISTKNMLQGFLDLFKTEDLIKRTSEELNRYLEKNPQMASSIRDIVGEELSWNDETSCAEISSKGTCLLLCHFGYLTTTP